MLNLLPQLEKKRIINAYKMRFAAITLIFICALLIISSIGLLPSYVSEKAKADEITSRQEEASRRNTEATIENAAAATAANKILADQLEVRITSIEKVLPSSSIMNRIFTKAGANVSIREINIIDGSVTVSGTASTRSELIAFHQRLREDTDFKLAVLPIANITKSVNPLFSIVITLP
jgi:hypothetical protein